MPMSNAKPSSPRRWSDSQTGIRGSSTGSVASDHYYVGQRRSPGESFSKPLTFQGVRGSGRLLRGCSPPLPKGFVPVMVDGSSPYHNSLWGNTPRPPEVALARNRAWARLAEKVKSEESALAVAAAEGRQTFMMVAKRVTGLYRAYSALRKGDFRRFLRELSTNPKRKHRSTVRTAANEAAGIWLEYWFGWAPTVQDIGSAAIALSVNPVIASVRERATSRLTLPTKDVNVGMSFERRRITQSVRGLVRHGAEFRLKNENLFLANRLGLVNPLSIAWELVPFSFVVDWFTSFGAYLQSFTDFAGLEIVDPWSLEFYEVHQRGDYWFGTDFTNRCTAEWRYVIMHRHTSLLSPLPVRPRLLNFGQSLTRAASAVSLLTSIFLDGPQPRGRK